MCIAQVLLFEVMFKVMFEVRIRVKLPFEQGGEATAATAASEGGGGEEEGPSEREEGVGMAVVIAVRVINLRSILLITV